MSELHYLNISELSELIRQKQVSSTELTRAVLARIERLDERLQSFATLTADSALADAEAADKAISDGTNHSALHGIPLAFKDLFYVKDVRCMGGSAALRNFVPAYDATVVRRLRKAGAVILGKLNLTEGAMMAYNPQFQAPFNPWDETMSPGGSSSGSGVATAAGLCYGSFGSDTGGSIRFPSAMCGVVGIKPTWGRVSRHGVLDLAPSLDHVGPMARSVKDAALLLEIVAGADEQDPTTIPAPAPALGAAMEQGVHALRVGFAEEYASQDVDPETASEVRAAAQHLVDQGAQLVETVMPELDGYILAWRDICSAEATTSYATSYPQHATAFGPWLRSWLSHGASISATNYARAHHLRLECSGVVARVFRNIDVLVCPAMLGPWRRPSDDALFAQAAGAFDPSRQRFTTPFNFNGAPSVTMPSTLNRAGLPLSVQFVASPGREDHALRAARAYEQATNSTSRHPSL